MKVSSIEYATIQAYDELFNQQLIPREVAKPLIDYLSSLDNVELTERQQAVDAAILAMGITFTIYSDAGNIDRPWSFDIVPRVISSKEWDTVQKGLKQRLTALNLFISVCSRSYSKQAISNLLTTILRNSMKHSPHYRHVKSGHPPS